MLADQSDLFDLAVRTLCQDVRDRSHPGELTRQLGVVVESLKQGLSPALLARLHHLPSDIKVLIIQQYFRHTEPGSHKTSFDHCVVSELLSTWFGIHLAPEGNKADTSSIQFPGRVGTKAVYRIPFGATDIFMYMNSGKDESARRLARHIGNDLVLTTDTTSPPCMLAEFVPLWMKDRGLPREEYYICQQREHPVIDYFSGQIGYLQSNLGVDVQAPSTEMAIVANGDGLRFHRDRLVNQYVFLEGHAPAGTRYEVVQDLTLIDWDMQVGTMSGTAFDHPNGDRYIFALYAGEVVGLFFSEPPTFPGPMMMPYHCALPVFDRSADLTVGPGKGKRLSTLVRGLADPTQLVTLRARSERMGVNDITYQDESSYLYSNGVRVIQITDLPRTELVPVAILGDDGEGVSVVELCSRSNRDLLSAVMGNDTRGVRLFHLQKQGEGFTTLSKILPDVSRVKSLVLINRSRPHRSDTFSYPVAFDFGGEGKPWIQLCRLRESAAVIVPASQLSLLRLSPSDEILQREALVDSFHAVSVMRPRIATVMDVIARFE